MFKDRKYILLLFVATIFTILSACATKEDNGTVNNDGDSTSEKTDIKIRTRDDPDFLDPHLIQASLTEQMMLNVFEGLLAPDTDGTLKPALAEDYEVSNGGLTYTFTLRDDVTFHNGDPLTVDDVIYSFNRLTGEESGEPLTSDFDDIEKIEAPDDQTIVITLSQVNSTFLSYLTAVNAAIIPESNDSAHNDHPIGTGPFKFVSYSPGSNVVMEKFDDYWQDGIPFLEEATFVIQPDDEAAFLSFQAGEIDLLDIPAHRIPEVEDDYQIEYQEANSSLLIGFSQNEELFNDLKVRQAINYAINKDEVIEAAFSSYATKIGSNMSPAMGSFYKEGLEDYYETDLKKAKELLAEAGYPDGFSTTITVSSHTQRYSDIAQVAVENLKEIGIDADIEVVEWGVWLDRVYQGRDFEMTVIDFTGKLSPYDILERYESDSSGNFMSYENDPYDQVLQKVLEEEDLDKQVELYHQAQEILTEDAAAVFLADYQSIWAMDNKVEGFKKYPIFFLDLSSITYN